MGLLLPCAAVVATECIGWYNQDNPAEQKQETVGGRQE